LAISKAFIEELKSRNRIEDVIGMSVNLRRAGRNLVGLCPFHSERTPSFNVNTTEGYFHCFGCGEGGDVITFVMKHERLEYIEAIKMLAERSGLTIPEGDEDSRDERLAKLKSRILAANREAARFFHQTLRESPAAERARAYFAQRGLTPATVVKYGLGYALPGWNALTDHLRAAGFTDFELREARLAGGGAASGAASVAASGTNGKESNSGGINGSKGGKNSGGNIYDFFRDRVMFPIIDLRGNVIGFGGRIMDGDGPKYINTPENPVFHKGSNLFSLNFAKKAEVGSLILCEGYMDVIALNQAGFENAVATLGTALTPEQARLAGGYAQEVFISYDADEAGRRAASKAINLLSEAGIRTKIIEIPGAKDPDEYIKKFGAASFRNILSKSGSAADFRLSKAAEGLDLSDPGDKITYLDRAAKIIAELPPKHRIVYTSDLAAKLRLPSEQLRTLIEDNARKNSRSRENDVWESVTGAVLRGDAKLSKAERVEKHIWAYLQKNPDAGHYIRGNLVAEDFVTDLSVRIYNLLKKCLEENVEFSILRECDPADQGKITEIMEIAQAISITNAEFVNSIEYLKNRPPKPGEMTDEDLRNLFSK
jgi:DNA primase